MSCLEGIALGQPSTIDPVLPWLLCYPGIEIATIERDIEVGVALWNVGTAAIGRGQQGAQPLDQTLLTGWIYVEVDIVPV